MKKEQIKEKTQNKLKAIQTLCEQLQMTVSAEEIIDSNGFIKKLVYYQDNEKYPIEETKEDVQIPDVRKEDDKAGV